MASVAVFTSSAKIRHCGSISKSQCDLLFGSFQIIAASTMDRPPSACRRMARGLRGINRARPFVGDWPPFADEHFGLGVNDNLEPGAAQHRLRAGAVGDPPVGRITAILVLDAVHARAAGPLEDVRLPEVI